MPAKKPIVLAILDGWGLGKPSPQNAISLAHIPHMTKWMREYPSTQLTAYGAAVGLTGTTTGNSEVGHLNLGAGYVVMQDEVRINQAIEDGSFFDNEVLVNACNTVNTAQSNLHILGLVSSGQVHASLEHIWALLTLAKEQNVSNIFVHIFSDGRDASPTWLGKNAEAVSRKVTSYGATVASVCGRYYAMDRDQRWDRTEQAYNLLTERKGVKAADLAAAVKRNYDQDRTDEFIEPMVIGNGQAIADGDVVIFANFRSDRARQLTASFVDPAFTGFDRSARFEHLSFYTMTEYQPDLAVSGVVFGPSYIKQPLAKVLAETGLKQLHAAESEKYAHVTYFFNGGQEAPFKNEQRIVVSSPKVATYDLQPAMSALELTDQVIKALQSQEFDVVIMNYANADMVAHTGNLQATVEAVEVVDTCLGKLVDTLAPLEGVLMITADHGNAEVLLDKNGEMDTQHNSGVVPLIAVGPNLPGKLKPGVLANVSPTLLELLAITPPRDMTAESLWVKEQNKS